MHVLKPCHQFNQEHHAQAYSKHGHSFRIGSERRSPSMPSCGAHLFDVLVRGWSVFVPVSAVPSIRVFVDENLSGDEIVSYAVVWYAMR